METEEVEWKSKREAHWQKMLEKCEDNLFTNKQAQVGDEHIIKLAKKIIAEEQAKADL